jgi:hypothetical protein
VVATVVIRELGKGEQTGPRSWVLCGVSTQIVFDNSVESFALTIGLGMICSGHASLDDLNIADFSPEFGRDTGVSISDNASWRSKAAFDVFKEQLGEVNRS